MTRSRGRAHFDRLYQANPDPWDYRTSAYEAAKYRHTLAALCDRRFASGLEVGCSIGVLTALLAERCDTLVAIDVVERALDAARGRNADRAWVRFACMQAPDAWPNGSFDLIVLSEVLYFFVPADLDRVAGRVLSSLRPGGTVLLVNWLGDGGDPLSGEEAASHFLRATVGHLLVTQQERRPDYRLDVLRSSGRTGR
jgi:SAM-dependent methyltransferase